MTSLTIAAVIIGRNEGQRLITCFESLQNVVDFIVYVDSGSIDNSLKEAQQRNIDFIPLDMSIPFTAARARNEGAAFLTKKYPDLKYLQFVDGDCEVQPGWINKANTFLENNSEYAIVCGRRRERYPKNSIYNQLCNIEWNTPLGEALECGGDALIKIEAFQQVEGYRGDLIAGEDSEMCFRFRQKGLKIWRIDAEMTLHDAAITTFFQWWKRNLRAGYAYAEGAHIHKKSSGKYREKACKRVWIWGILYPLIIIVLLGIDYKFIILALVYPLRLFRLILKNKKFEKVQAQWAFFVILGNFPEAIGLLKYLLSRITKKKSTIIEYK